MLRFGICTVGDLLLNLNNIECFDAIRDKSKIMFLHGLRHSIPSWLKELRHTSCILKKKKLNVSKSSFPVRFNLFHPQPSLFLFCFRINPLVFFFLSKPLFLGLLTL